MTDDLADDPFANGANPFEAHGFEDLTPPSAAPDSGKAKFSLGFAPPAVKPQPAPIKDDDPFAGGKNPFEALGFEDLRPKQSPERAAPSGPLGNASDDSYLSSIAKGIGTAAIKGAADIPGIAGNLHDLGQLATDYLFAGGQTAVGKLMGSNTTFAENMAKNEATRQAVQDSMRKDMGGWIDYAKLPSGHDISQPVLNKTGEYVPETEAGRLGMAGVEAAVGSVVPGEAVGGLLANGGRAVANFTAGAAGQGAADATGNPLLGAAVGASTAGGLNIAGKGAGAIADAYREHVPPFTERQRQAAAKAQVGRELNENAVDAPSAISNVQTLPREIVPGSPGTLGQISGDPGILAYEKGVSQTPEGVAPFSNYTAAQNNARVAHLDSVQPDGNILDLPQGLRDQRVTVDQNTAAQKDLVDTVTAGHLARAQALHDKALDDLKNIGPQASPADVAASARNMRDALAYQHELQAAEAQKAAEAARIGVAPRAQTPEQAGANLRDPAINALQARKDADDALYAAARVPDGATIPSRKIAEASQSIQRSMPPEASPMAAEEQRLFDLAAKYGDEESFNRIKALRTSILDQQAVVRRTDPAAYRRLNQLRQPVEDAIDHINENRAALDQIAVQRGAIAADDTIRGRLSKWQDELEQSRNAIVAQQQASGAAGRGVSSGATGARPTADAGLFREESKRSERSGNSPGDQRISASSLQVTPEQAQALRTANASFKDQRETFGEGPLGDILSKSGRGAFDYSNAEVPRQVFHPGPTGGEDVRAYLKGVGPERGVPAISDAAALALRDKAARTDGTLDPNKVDAFLKDHQTALAELPAEVRNRFATTADAERTLAEVQARHRDVLSDFDKSEVGKLAGVNSSGDVVGRVGSILDSHVNPQQRLGEIAQAAKGNSAAESGLKRAIVEHVLNKFVPEVGNPKVDALRNYFADKKNVLGAVLSPDEIRDIENKATEVTTAKNRVAEAGANRQQALKQADANRNAELSKFDRGTLGQIIGIKSSDDVLGVVRAVLKSTTGAVRMEALAKKAETIPGGTDALKRAVVESVKRDITSATEAGVSGQLEQKRAVLANFMRDKSDALKAAGLSETQMGKLRAIVEDGLRSNRTISVARARGGSDSLQNAQRAALLNRGEGSILSKLAVSAALMTVGHDVGGTVGALVGHGIGHEALAALRDAGLDTVKKMRVEAVLNPDFGLALMQSHPSNVTKSASAKLALQARKLSIAGQIANRAQQDVK